MAYESILDSKISDNRYNVFLTWQMFPWRRWNGTLPYWVVLRYWYICLWIIIDGRSFNAIPRNLNIALFYMPPDRELHLRVSKLISCIKWVIELAPLNNYIIAGDLNLPCLQWCDGQPLVVTKSNIKLQNADTELVIFVISLTSINIICKKQQKVPPCLYCFVTLALIYLNLIHPC